MPALFPFPLLLFPLHLLASLQPSDCVNIIPPLKCSFFLRHPLQLLSCHRNARASTVSQPERIPTLIVCTVFVFDKLYFPFISFTRQQRLLLTITTAIRCYHILGFVFAGSPWIMSNTCIDLLRGMSAHFPVPETSGIQGQKHRRELEYVSVWNEYVL